MNVTVRAGCRLDARELSRVLGRAFYYDPLMRWLLACNDARARRLPLIFATMARHHDIAGGGVQVALGSGKIAGAALWSPPGRWRDSRSEQLRMLPGMLLAFGGRIPAFKLMSEVVERQHPEQPHWYLGAIGSDPTVRGMGFDRALMESGLERCDTQYAPAYLESTNPVNVPYYERFGFETTGQFALPRGAPVITTMWRQARL